MSNLSFIHKNPELYLIGGTILLFKLVDMVDGLRYEKRDNSVFSEIQKMTLYSGIMYCGIVITHAAFGTMGNIVKSLIF